MQKALRIISVISGLISFVSVVILGYLYFEKFCDTVRAAKDTVVRYTNPEWPEEE